MDRVAENTVLTVERVDVRIVPGALDYALENHAAIRANWQRECAANPSLYDGEIYLAPEARLEHGVLTAGFRRTSFATLMHWRRDPARMRPWHIFSVGVITSREGDLIAAEMGHGHAIAGRIYFPAGTVDNQDIVDGRVDYNANMLREVREETGLDLGQARMEPHFNLVTSNRSIALFRRFRFDASTWELVAAINDFLARQSMRELARIIPVSRAGQLGEATPPYVRAFADWHFMNS
ncbi:NUDIX hydrolase [Daeguia caeni]|uniref:NUDIX hydrolase n=1 Tax=Daeguia caeni TaxID=439612 RepID=A0ABV9H7Q8_9HYPH